MAKTKNSMSFNPLDIKELPVENRQFVKEIERKLLIINTNQNYCER